MGRGEHCSIIITCDQCVSQGEAGDPCGETYRGPSAASEKEVQAIVKYLKANAPVVGGLDFHSFSQIIVYPYGKEAKQS